MKKILCAGLLAGFMFFGATTSQAQTSKSTTHRRTTTSHSTIHRSTRSNTMSNVGAEGNVPPGGKSEAEMRAATAGDPLYLNHPYFNGEARWSVPDSLYKHGDFPWAMVAKNPDNFRYNPDTGGWEMLNSPALGSSRPTR